MLKQRIYPDTFKKQEAALATDETMLTYKARREQFASDPYRPIYHISALWWIGDPCGLCHWQDRYHVFYQDNPEGKGNGVHWGHFYSRDLVHWQDLPPALYPDPDTEAYCYTGQTVVDGDRVIALYNANLEKSIDSGCGVATGSDPLLFNWKKHPGNPVIPPGLTDSNNRPYEIGGCCIWLEQDGYYALARVGHNEPLRERRKTTLLLFHSRDLEHWEFLHPLLDDVTFSDWGDDGCCPNFWPIGRGKHILMCFSHKSGTRYYVGTYDAESHQFEPEYHARLKHGINGGYIGTPSATIDQKGRVLAMHQFYEGMTSFAEKSDWYGCMTVPWHLSLGEDDSLCIEPVEELKSLRFNHQRVEDQQVGPNTEHVFDNLGGKAIEINLVLDMGTAREAGLCVLRSSDGREQTRISIFNQWHMKQNDALQLDICEASLRTDLVGQPPERAPFRLSMIEGDPSVEKIRPLRLRILIDRSVVEVFADNMHCDPKWAYPRQKNWIFPLFPRQYVGSRVYPTLDDSRGISFFARGGETKIVSMDVWQMRAAWPELKHREGE